MTHALQRHGSRLLAPPFIPSHPPSLATERRQRQAAFTLIEVLAAVFLTSVVVTVAITFYINLSDSSTRAAEKMRNALHATAMLEQVSRDIEGARLLVKPPEVDPLNHPWFFVAENRYGWQGADRVMFVTRSQTPRTSSYHMSDIAVVAYFVEPQEDESLTLYRWASPGLPLSYKAEFPLVDDDRTLVLGEGLESFAILFLAETGEWTEEWDSSQLVESSELPLAAEIQVSMMADRPEKRDDFLVGADTTGYYARTVALPMRPFDLESLIKEKQADEAAAGTSTSDESSGGGRTIGDLMAEPGFLERCVSELNKMGMPGQQICADQNGLPPETDLCSLSLPSSLTGCP